MNGKNAWMLCTRSQNCPEESNLQFLEVSTSLRSLFPVYMWQSFPSGSHQMLPYHFAVLVSFCLQIIYGEPLRSPVPGHALAMLQVAYIPPYQVQYQNLRNSFCHTQDLLHTNHMLNEAIQVLYFDASKNNGNSKSLFARATSHSTGMPVHPKLCTGRCCPCPTLSSSLPPDEYN